MSVINKMLRDLDSRQTTASGASAAQHQGRDLIRGTSVLVSRERGSRRRSVWIMPLIGGLILLSILAGVGLWWQTRNMTPMPVAAVKPSPAVQGTATPTPIQTAMPVAVDVTKSGPIQAPVASTPPAPPTVQSQPAATTLAVPSPQAAPQPAPPPSASPAVVKAAAPVPTPTPNPAPPPAPAKSATLAALPSAPPALAAPLAPAAPVLQRQSAALDALAQAQGLWNAGARDAAVEVLREAITLAQQQGAGNNNPALIPLARELARMLVADNHIIQALEMLTRLEPALSGQADLWAVRGNAAQRLAKHPEAVTAYLTALKLRPGEPRWMLGAAISQAIQGQLAEAGDLTEQVRAKGALSAELRTYLRQLGVEIRDN